MWHLSRFGIFETRGHDFLVEDPWSMKPCASVSSAPQGSSVHYSELYSVHYSVYSLISCCSFQPSQQIKEIHKQIPRSIASLVTSTGDHQGPPGTSGRPPTAPPRLLLLGELRGVETRKQRTATDAPRGGRVLGRCWGTAAGSWGRLEMEIIK